MVESTDATGPDFATERELLRLSECTYRTIAVARGLVESRRDVDMTGIQEQVGLVCARALDLPPGQTGLAKAVLHRLIAGLDTLQIAMRENAA